MESFDNIAMEAKKPGKEDILFGDGEESMLLDQAEAFFKRTRGVMRSFA